MRKTFTYLLLLFCFNTFGQTKRILCYNLIDGTVDTLNIVDYDTTIIREHTNYFVGNINEDYTILSEVAPVENVYPESNFTRKRQASLDYDINDFPIRTSVRLFKWVNDSLKSKCSGSMVSKKHVLTAGHCVAHLYKDSLLYDSLYVSPVFDNGEASALFDGSWVSKIYIFENWSILQNDFSILELEESIGERLGWLSIGFDSDDLSLLDGIFYKFSYPATYIPEIDSNSYNGDTLYYGYGLADVATNEHIMITNASGIPGESGSSLIKISNENFYTSYGVLSYSQNLRHCRLTNREYFALKNIIRNDLSVGIPELEKDEYISVYPNPATEYINIRLPNEIKKSTLCILDLQGRTILNQFINKQETSLNISGLREGIYLLIIESENKRIVRKVIKKGN